MSTLNILVTNRQWWRWLCCVGRGNGGWILIGVVEDSMWGLLCCFFIFIFFEFFDGIVFLKY